MNQPHPLLRSRVGHHAKVTNEELCFDLVYAFAITQIAHQFLYHISLVGVIQVAILWFAIWLGWQYTCWVTNWFDPTRKPIRIMLFMVMLLGLIAAAAIPGAFADKGLIFSCAFAAMQVGRTLFVLWQLGPGHALTPNFRRMLAWLSVSAILWIGGGVSEDGPRMLLWVLAVLCEYLSPTIGFAFPGLGKSSSRDWTIDGGHLIERCQLFLIIAIGEIVLSTGRVLSDADVWTAATMSALLAAFAGTIAMWWLYFGTAAEDATKKIIETDDPGQVGAQYHYTHAVLMAGIILTAVGNELVLAHPHGAVTVPYALTLSIGPAIYVFGSALYKRVVYGRFSLSHLIGAMLLLALVPVALNHELLFIGWVTTGIMVFIGAWESVARRAVTLVRKP